MCVIVPALLFGRGLWGFMSWFCTAANLDSQFLP
jgi:hypothetical protein